MRRYGTMKWCRMWKLIVRGMVCYGMVSSDTVIDIRNVRIYRYHFRWYRQTSVMMWHYTTQREWHTRFFLFKSSVTIKSKYSDYSPIQFKACILWNELYNWQRQLAATSYDRILMRVYRWFSGELREYLRPCLEEQTESTFLTYFSQICRGVIVTYYASSRKPFLSSSNILKAFRIVFSGSVPAR